jgi:hypothetical protein
MACRATARTIPAVDRFWSYVNKTETCWLWTSYLLPNGYAYFSDKVNGRHIRIYIHRFSWELHYGPIPPGLCVCHHCDVRHCIRPDHLFLGTVTENAWDMLRKRRHPNMKLADAQVIEIRARYAAGGVTQQQLATEYGVYSSNISVIVNHKTWRHLL